MIIHFTLVVLSFVGMLISVYFTLVIYHIMKPDARIVPLICRMEEGACFAIIDTRDARVFGVPNAFLGILYYLSVIVFVTMFQSDSESILYQVVVSISAGTVILGAYLTYALLLKLRTPCPLCFIGHGINLGIFLLLLTY